MVRLAGIEPATLGLEGRCSIQLSYRRALRLSLLTLRGATAAGEIVPGIVPASFLAASWRWAPWVFGMTSISNGRPLQKGHKHRASLVLLSRQRIGDFAESLRIPAG